MTKSLIGLAVPALATCLLLGSAHAQPVAGNADYSAMYDRVIVACSVPVGTVEDCSIALNAYVDRLVADDVDIDAANDSISAARSTVFEINGRDPADEEFQIEIDNLFELLVPNSGAVGDDGLTGFTNFDTGGSNSEPQFGSRSF